MCSCSRAAGLDVPQSTDLANDLAGCRLTPSTARSWTKRSAPMPWQPCWTAHGIHSTKQAEEAS